MVFCKTNRSPYHLLTILLLAAVLLVTAGCPSTLCLDELKKAQDMFNTAYQGQAPGSEATSQQQEKYQQVVEQVDKKTLPCLDRDDLKVQAYAIDAYAKWEMGKYTEAISDAQKGQALYERAGKTTNPRDYGMLLIVPGYAIHSQAHERYKERLKQGFLTKEEAQQFSREMENALKEIDAVNAKLDKNEEIVIRANQEQLRIVWDAINMWSVGIKDPKDQEPEVRRWLGRADEIAKKFPPGDYPSKARTQELLQKIDKIRKVLGPAS